MRLDGRFILPRDAPLVQALNHQFAGTPAWRYIPRAGLRIREARQMGFERCVMPDANIDPADRPIAGSCELVGIRSVGEALDALLD